MKVKKGQEWTKETKETEQEEEKKQVARRRQDWPKGEKETEQERHCLSAECFTTAAYGCRVTKGESCEA